VTADTADRNQSVPGGEPVSFVKTAELEPGTVAHDLPVELFVIVREESCARERRTRLPTFVVMKGSPVRVGASVLGVT
jgi:hypothetical protein